MKEKFDSATELLEAALPLGSVHIECNQEMAEKVFKALYNLSGERKTAYVLCTDKGYERESVQSYLRFWADMQGGGIAVPKVMELFRLESIARKKIRELSPGELMRVQIARVCMQEAELVFLQEPLLDLDGEGIKCVLSWMAECQEKGVRFVTTNASMRHALLMQGGVYYMEDGMFVLAQQEEDGDEKGEDELIILKIPAKAGGSTLLFEPKDIDYVESMNKSNYISVRGTLYQVSQTMDEMEQSLGKSGFFRCHRSYLVNMQRVEQIEKLSRNSFCLLLGNKEQSRIPLSKGRAQEMKELFGW